MIQKEKVLNEILIQLEDSIGYNEGNREHYKAHRKAMELIEKLYE